MSEHPIEGLMITAMNSIQDMVDVNTIIGEPIETSNNIVIIPISKVSFGFAAGGSEFRGETVNEYSKKDKEEEIQYRLPFGGGSGAGVCINPVAFLVVQPEGVRLVSVNHMSALDKFLDYIPDIIEKANGLISGKKQKHNNCSYDNENINKSTSSADDESIKKETINKAKPKKTRSIPNKPETITYEYEYDETMEDDVEEDVDYNRYDD